MIWQSVVVLISSVIVLVCMISLRRSTDQAMRAIIERRKREQLEKEER